MILFKGRSSLKQCNPMKPIKRGYKIWAKADMDGYMSKFSMYQCKKGEIETLDVPNCTIFMTFSFENLVSGQSKEI